MYPSSITIFLNHIDLFYSAPLLSNILPHLQTLLNFIVNTLPKPVLVALCYRLIVLHFASRILPTIGANSWDDREDRPVSSEIIHPESP